MVLPNLATLRIAALDEKGTMLGHRVLPVEGLRPGYRHICLRNELNQPQGVASLFVYIRAKDYVSDAFAGWDYMQSHFGCNLELQHLVNNVVRT